MKTNHSIQATPYIRMISEDQIYQIHLATLEVLERVGVMVDNEEAMNLLREAGCYIHDNVAKIPAHLIEEAIRTAPPRIVMCDRDGNRKLFLEKNETYYGTGSDLPFTIDPYTQERRFTTKKDIENSAKTVDYLPNFDFFMSFGIATDVPEVTSDLHQLDAMVRNTKKPMIVTAHHRQGLLDQIHMCAAVRGGVEELREKPLIICYSEPVSPLKHTLEGTDKLLVCAEYGVPVVYTPGLMAGATAPATRAGAILQANAELLSGLVIHQLKVKGAPFVYGGVATIMDMMTSVLPYGSPEWHSNSIILTQMAQYYQLPIFSTGGCTDSLVFDQQAAAEATYTLLMANMSGANLIHDVGYLEQGLTACYDTLVFCDEIIDMVRRIRRNLEINEETLAIDVIEKVGPGGHFLTNPHTYKHWRNEMWVPKLINRERFEEWEAMGKPTMGDKCNKKAREILETYEPERLPEGVQEQLAAIIAKAEKRYLK